MNEVKTLKIHALSTAASPLTHMRGTSGNEAVINRTRVLYGGMVCEVPTLSGNAIRHKMVREPGAMFLVTECGLYGRLNIDQANFLFYGGSLTESAIAENLGRIAAMQELLPLYRLLGGSLKNQVLAGSLLVGMGTLVCEENREVLERLLPEDLIVGMPELRPCEDFVSGWQYTRGDAMKKPALLSEEAMEGEDRDKSNLMIYSGQHVIPGAVFYHGFTLQNVNRLEIGALYAALEDWGATDGTLGGQGRIGHGSIRTEVYADGKSFFGDELDMEACAREYRGHVKANREDIAAWLNEAFPAAGRPAGKKASADKSADKNKEGRAAVSTVSQMNLQDAQESFGEASAQT